MHQVGSFFVGKKVGTGGYLEGEEHEKWGLCKTHLKASWWGSVGYQTIS
jgi:hypothetical protein